MKLSFDYQNMAAATGISEVELATQVSKMDELYAEIQRQKREGSIGFCALPYQELEIDQIEALAAEVRNEFTALIVIGIGGSDLGARAVHRALNHQFYNLSAEIRNHLPQLFFLGDTTDPVAIQEVLEVVDITKTAIVVISKSGNTVEQMSTFIYLRQLIIDHIGEEASKRSILVLTDREDGALREIVRREGYRSLVIPATVGGRFSVLSSVGLFPLAVVGINIRQLLEGAREMDQLDSTGESPAVTYAAAQYLAYIQGKMISVFMPYTYSLREVGFWYRQLWAESLGKRYDSKGEEVFVGPTPIASVGPTDQHSQVQLYMEGPKDKVFTFLIVDSSLKDMTLPQAYSDLEGVRYLAGHTFSEIIQSELTSTAQALAEAGRPSCTLRLDCLDEHSLGALLYFFELSVTYMGALLQVNTFDQPGVEIGKKHMYRLLGRPGF